MTLPIILIALFSAVPLSASAPPPPTLIGTGCMLQVGPRSIDFGDVPVGTGFTDLKGASLLALSPYPTATETIAVNLSFDPSPPFFDGYTRTGSSGGSLPPGSIDDHLIRCLP